MPKARLLFTFFLCIALIMTLVGCNILDSLIKEGGSAPLGNILNKTTPSSDATPVVTLPQPQGEQSVKLYFVDKDGKTLVEETRIIPKTLSLARETVSQWLLGPASGMANTYPAVDPATVLKDINIKNGVATVDLSKEYLQPYANVTGEAALYGLVNTVAQFSTVQIVKIRVEGQDLKSYRGLKTEDLRFRNDMIGYSSGPAAPKDTHQTPENSTAQDGAPLVGSDKALSPSSVNIFTH